MGFLSPAIILPDGYALRAGDAHLRHVLLHEAAHLERRDDWTNLAARTIHALFWFHPVVSFLARQIRIEREFACDDRAAAAAGNPRGYAESLTRAIELGSTQSVGLLAAGVAEGKSQVSMRIQALLDQTRDRSPRVQTWQLGVLTLVLAASTAVADFMPSVFAYGDHVVQEVGVVPAAPEPPSPPEPPVPASARPPASVSAPTPPPPPAPGAPSGPRAPVLRAFLASFAAVPQAPAAPASAAEGETSKGPGFIAGLAAQGYKNLTVDQLIQLKIHGVSPEYIGQLKSAGLSNLTPDQLVQLRIHGVTAESVQQARKLKSEITVDQIIRLKTAGVF